MSYAQETTVPVSRSRDEIERTLTRYGATAFASGWQPQAAAVQFDMRGRRVQFVVPLPGADAFVRTPTGRARSASQARAAMEQEHRRLWRCLALVIKSKLEAIESGIVSFDEELAMHFVLPDGTSVAQRVLPGIEAAYDRGDLRPLLAIGH